MHPPALKPSVLNPNESVLCCPFCRSDRLALESMKLIRDRTLGDPEGYRVAFGFKCCEDLRVSDQRLWVRCERGRTIFGWDTPTVESE